MLFAEIVVDCAEREHFEFFEQGHFPAVVEVLLHFAKTGDGFEKRLEKGLLHVAGADHPGDDAVDGRIEIVQSDMDAVNAVADDFALDFGFELRMGFIFRPFCERIWPKRTNVSFED